MQEVFKNIIKQAEEMAVEFELFGQCRDFVNIEGLKRIIRETTNGYNNGWIPCSERLPESKSKSFGSPQQRIEVIACKRNGVVKEMLYEFATKEFWEAGDCNPISHWKEDSYDSDCEIIAWQPLPEPYQPKED